MRYVCNQRGCKVPDNFRADAHGNAECPTCKHPLHLTDGASVAPKPDKPAGAKKKKRGR